MLWGALAVILAFPGISARAAESGTEGLFVNQIAIDPNDSKTLYAATAFSAGLLKSTDAGKSWTQMHQGIKSLSFTQIVVDPADSSHLYLADGCAGLYVSHDGGRAWTEMNDGLQNTEIGVLVLDPTEGGSAYAVTTRGVHKTEGGGKRWTPMNQGDTFTDSFDFIGLVALSTHPATLYLASHQGLYTRKAGDAGWVPVGDPFAGKQISALAYDPGSQRLYAAVFRRGVLETLQEGGLFVSKDEGKQWTRLGDGLAQDRIRVIRFDPSDSRTIYLATSGRGVLKSVNGGKSWKEANAGLTDPNRDIRSLVIDPRDSNILYAGSYGRWLFRSGDAARSWTPLPLGPHQTAEQLIAGLNRDDEAARINAPVKVSPPPAEFKKCNQCHGWIDPRINMVPHTLWKVPANRRNWGPTVKRMSQGAGLTPKEEKSIEEFLQRFSEQQSPP